MGETAPAREQTFIKEGQPEGHYLDLGAYTAVSTAIPHEADDFQRGNIPPGTVVTVECPPALAEALQTGKSYERVWRTDQNGRKIGRFPATHHRVTVAALWTAGPGERIPANFVEIDPDFVLQAPVYNAAGRQVQLGSSFYVSHKSLRDAAAHIDDPSQPEVPALPAYEQGKLGL